MNNHKDTQVIGMEQETFESKLKVQQHLNKYPSLIPWVGREYGKAYKRLLIIGESHYLPKGVEFHHSDTDWYSAEEAVLKLKISEEANTVKDKEKGITWIRTSGILRKRSKQGGKNRTAFKKGHAIYQRIFSAMNDTLFSSSDYRDTIDHVAYYNYFQRPAKTTGGSISPTSLDKKVAEDVFKHVIDVLQPDLIVVVSRKAGKSVIPQIKLSHKPYVVTPHPACSWWNRPSKANGNKTGRELFTDFLSHHNKKEA
jgi:hypothetical protein